jgi:hypothetical protein
VPTVPCFDASKRAPGLEPEVDAEVEVEVEVVVETDPRCVCSVLEVPRRAMPEPDNTGEIVIL